MMNRMMFGGTVATLVVAAHVGSASAYELRHRLVWHVNGQNVVANGNQFNIPPQFHDQPLRFRVQFGVFDDASGPAPAGGFIGWNVGTLRTNSSDRWEISRTPGRLNPFVFARNGNGTQNGNQGWTDIDATLGTQSPPWPPGSDPNTPPLPTIYGVNEWESVYEVTMRARFQQSYLDGFLDYSGNAIAATEWRTVGTPIPPKGDEYGMVTYAPFPTPPVEIERMYRILLVPVPNPPAGAAMVLGMLIAGARRRR